MVNGKNGDSWPLLELVNQRCVCSSNDVAVLVCFTCGRRETRTNQDAGVGSGQHTQCRDLRTVSGHPPIIDSMHCFALTCFL